MANMNVGDGEWPKGFEVRLLVDPSSKYDAVNRFLAKNIADISRELKEDKTFSFLYMYSVFTAGAKYFTVHFEISSNEDLARFYKSIDMLSVWFTKFLQTKIARSLTVNLELTPSDENDIKTLLKQEKSNADHLQRRGELDCFQQMPGKQPNEGNLTIIDETSHKVSLLSLPVCLSVILFSFLFL